MTGAAAYRLACAIAAVLALMGSGAGLAGAQQAPVPMPQDTRLVVFRYDPNDSYLLLTRPGAVTHIALEPEESVLVLALGDTVQWIVQDKGPNVFVKPIRPDLYTSGTLVTNRRTYQLGLRSSPEGGAWYQRVSWTFPEMIALARDARPVDGRGREAREAQPGARARPGDREHEERDPIGGIRLERLNFDYRIHGQAAFRPTQVFDDGRFTYIQMPATLQEMPALFVSGEAGEGELVNYTVRGRFLVVQRLADRFLLRLGSSRMELERGQPLDPSGRRRVIAADGLHEASQ